MSSKFFTWTKGDRSRHASETLFTGAVVPIPVECIHIKGFDYSRAQKSSRRRPVPLKLDQSPEDLSSYDQQSDESTALQDAAVKSATSLMAVVNVMLRSPLASARLPPQTSSLAPNHGRPRSRTAPSTPLVEAPARPALVELPGSFPDRPRASYHHSFDGKVKTRMSQGPRHEQPCKSARRPSHPWLHHSPNSNDETSTADPPDVAARHDAHILSQHSRWESSIDESRRARASLPSGSTASQVRQSYASGAPASHHGLASHESNPRLPRSSLNIMREDNQHLTENHLETTEHNEVPLFDIASLHASHEDHMVTMVEAHEREVTSLRMYINFLEQRRGLTRTNEALSHTSARSCSELDASGKIAGRQMMEVPRSSAEGSYPSQQNSHHGYIDSTIDAHCTSYAGYGEIWLECNHLRDSLETCKRQIAHADETISRMHRLELSLKNENGNLRSRLLAANNERTDVQEGLYEACKDLRNLAERESSLTRENEQLRRRSLNATRPTISSDDAVETVRQRKLGHCRARSDVSYQHTRCGPPLAQNVIRSPMLPEDMQIRQIGTQPPERQQKAEVDDVRRQSNAHKSPMPEFTLSSARAVSLTNVAAPSLMASTKSVTTSIPRTSEGHRNEYSQVQRKGVIQNDDPQTSEHKLQEAAFDGSDDSSTTQSQQNTHPTTPKTKPTRTSDTPTARTPSPSPSLSSSKSSSTSSSALAISLPQTPRTVNSTIAGAPPLPTTGLCSLSHPRMPPAGVNKRLPKTPPLDSDPLLLPPAYSPVIKRGETMKSVGGSIIELYAGRGREDGSEWERDGYDEEKGWMEWV